MDAHRCSKVCRRSVFIIDMHMYIPRFAPTQSWTCIDSPSAPLYGDSLHLLHGDSDPQEPIIPTVLFAVHLGCVFYWRETPHGGSMERGNSVDILGGWRDYAETLSMHQTAPTYQGGFLAPNPPCYRWIVWSVDPCSLRVLRHVTQCSAKMPPKAATDR